MELDDLKADWNKLPDTGMEKDTFRKHMDTLAQSGRGIRRAFIAEVAIMSGIYLFLPGCAVLLVGQHPVVYVQDRCDYVFRRFGLLLQVV